MQPNDHAISHDDLDHSHRALCASTPANTDDVLALIFFSRPRRSRRGCSRPSSASAPRWLGFTAQRGESSRRFTARRSLLKQPRQLQCTATFSPLLVHVPGVRDRGQRALRLSRKGLTVHHPRPAFFGKVVVAFTTLPNGIHSEGSKRSRHKASQPFPLRVPGYPLELRVELK